MIKFNVLYNNTVQFPISAGDFFSALCQQVGLQAGNTNFVNSNYMIMGNPFTNNEDCRTVLSNIAQLAGGFAKIGRDNKVYIITLPNDSKYLTVKYVDEMTVRELDLTLVQALKSNSEVVKENIDGYNYFDDFSKNEQWGELNSLVLAVSDIEGENTVVQDTASIQENGLTEITINDNYFLSSQVDREAVIVPLWNYLKGIKYLPFKTKYYGYPYLDSGDMIYIKDSKDVGYISYILNHTFTYNGAFEGEIETPAMTKTQTAYKNTFDMRTKFKRVERRVDKANGQIEDIVEEIGDRSEKTTTVTQDIDGINQRVNYLEDFTKEKTEMNDIHLTDTIEGGGFITDFIIYGNTNNFVYLAPSATLTPSATLVPLGDHFTLVADIQSRTYGKSSSAIEIDIKLAEPIRNLGDVCDELRIIDGIVSVYRRIGIDNNNDLYILTTPTNEFIANLRIPTFNDNTYIYVDEYENLKYYAKYITKNDYSQYFATKVQLSTAITETEKQILLMAQQKLDTSTAEALFSVMADEISSKVSKDGVCSEISQSSDKIAVKGNRISIKSDFFELTEDGRIVATSGNIGGFELNQTSFSKNISGLYNYNSFDCVTILAYLRDHLNFDTNMTKIMDFNDDGEVTVLDIIKILNVLRGTEINTKNVSGTFEINSDDPKRCLIIKDQYGNEVLSLGLGGLNSQIISANQCIIGDLLANYNNSPYVAINGDTGNIYATGSITQASLAEKKKNFEKLENALDIIKAIDIYKYNLQIEDDKDKKHIGFVIGDEFKYSPDVTSKDNDGADTYSLASVCVKAIQELKQEVDELKAKLKGGNN